MVYIFLATFHLGFDLFQLTYTYIELKSNAAWFAKLVCTSRREFDVDGVFKAALLKHCSCLEWYAWCKNERITISNFVLSMINKLWRTLNKRFFLIYEKAYQVRKIHHIHQQESNEQYARYFTNLVYYKITISPY